MRGIVSSEARSADLPTVPTMIESGAPGYVVLTCTGVVALAATPAERRRRPAIVAAGILGLPRQGAREMARSGATVRHQD
jgi:tripartite-type tricarboxylate transporter receptor subunit TctC